MPAKNRDSTKDYVAFLGRMIRATGRRVGRGDAEDLGAFLGLEAVLAQSVQAAVDGLRADGWTWSSIGEAVGTTRQAALMRWGRHEGRYKGPDESPGG